MAYFAKLDDNNIVLEVHAVADAALDATKEEESGIAFLTEWSGGYTNWKQTSFNNRIRVRYAGIGMTYREDLDAFVLPKCHTEATLDEVTCSWVCNNLAHTVGEI